jgi:hypothetical protein
MVASIRIRSSLAWEVGVQRQIANTNGDVAERIRQSDRRNVIYGLVCRIRKSLAILKVEIAPRATFHLIP